MPNLIFLGIENPLGVLGQKIRDVVTNEKQLNPIASVTKEEEKSHRKRQDTTLQFAAARVLSGIIAQSVCISAPTLTIYNGHLDDLLNRIDAIRQDCPNGEDVFLNDKGEDPVPLVSRTS